MYRGSAAAKPKPAIPRPDRDYKLQVAARNYEEEEQARREELRLKQIEERQRQREAGQQVDLGKAQKYWEACASGQPTASKGGGKAQAQKGWGGYKGSPVGAGKGGPTRTTQSPSQPAAPPSRVVYAPEAEDPLAVNDPWLRDAPSNARGATRAVWQPVSKAAPPQQAQPQNPPPSTANAWDQSGQRWHENEGWGSGWSQSGWDEAQKYAAGESVQDLGTSASSSSLEDLLRLKPRSNLTDSTLEQYLAEMPTYFLGSRNLGRLDLTGNRLTDQGVNRLVAFLQSQNLSCESLWLQGNQLREPLALVNLLRDEHIGLNRALCELQLPCPNLTHEVLWRLLEVISTAHPRPPFRFIFGEGLPGPLLEVIAAAKEYGLTVSGPFPQDQQGSLHQADVDLLLLTFPVMEKGIFQ